MAINLAWHRPSVADIRKSLLTGRLCVRVGGVRGAAAVAHFLSSIDDKKNATPQFSLSYTFYSVVRTYS